MAYPSLVHGAYLSGVDAARKIENVLRPSKRWPDVLLSVDTMSMAGKGLGLGGQRVALAPPPPGTMCGFCNRRLPSNTSDEQDEELGPMVRN